MQKTEKIPCVGFTKLEKPYFGPTLSFKKKPRIHHFFKLDDTVILCKKSEKFYERFERKTLDKQTNRQTDDGRLLIGPHFMSSHDVSFLDFFFTFLVGSNPIGLPYQKSKATFALADYRIANKILYAVPNFISFYFLLIYYQKKIK